MKKWSKALITFLLFCHNTVEGQTYYYNVDQKINNDTGVRESYGYGYIYITFTNNKNSFYQSDSKGNQLIPNSRKKELGGSVQRQKLVSYVMGYNMFGPLTNSQICPVLRECDGIFNYNAQSNTRYQYCDYYYDYYLSVMSGGNRSIDEQGYLYVCFSKDYSNIYISSTDGNYEYVGKRVSDPNQAPSEMY